MIYKSDELFSYIRSKGIVSSIDVEKWAVASGCMSAETARRAVRRMVERGQLHALDHQDQVRAGYTTADKKYIARYSV